MTEDALYQQMAQAVLEGDPIRSAELAKRSLELGLPPLDAIQRGFRVGIEEVGRRFAGGDCFLPDLVLGGEAMKAALAQLKPALSQAAESRLAVGTIVIGTVAGDIHEIGKSLVAALLGAHGFEVHDLGTNVPVARFVRAVQETGAELVGLSALLTTTMRVQREVIGALTDAGLRARVKVLVGGAPVTQAWADQIGADGYAEDAAAAVALAKKLA
jgi:corrinoid protein of di/trimethylamine methyltransferase